MKCFFFIILLSFIGKSQNLIIEFDEFESNQIILETDDNIQFVIKPHYKSDIYDYFNFDKKNMKMQKLSSQPLSLISKKELNENYDLYIEKLANQKFKNKNRREIYVSMIKSMPSLKFDKNKIFIYNKNNQYLYEVNWIPIIK